jgi:hypothetical protein
MATIFPHLQRIESPISAKIPLPTGTVSPFENSITETLRLLFSNIEYSNAKFATRAAESPFSSVSGAEMPRQRQTR